MQWPKDKIEQLILRAFERGWDEAMLSSPREARLFRFAIKNYKKRHKTLNDRNLTDLTTEVRANSVRVILKPEIIIGKELEIISGDNN